MAVRFTQYLRPHGRPQLVEIDRPEEVERKAQWLVEHKCRLEAEVLMTEQVSFTVERDDAEGEVDVVAAEICENGPAVLAAVDRLVAVAFEKLRPCGMH